MSTTGKSGRPVMYPHAMVDALLKHVGVETDRDLAAALGVQPSAISKIRTGTNDVSPEMIIKIHKLTKWPVERIEMLAQTE